MSVHCHLWEPCRRPPLPSPAGCLRPILVLEVLPTVLKYPLFSSEGNRGAGKSGQAGGGQGPRKNTTGTKKKTAQQGGQ